jgi:hypothetical protein
VNDDEIQKFQMNMARADAQLARGKTRLVFLVGAVVGLVLCFLTRSDNLPVLTWITIPAFFGFAALGVRALLKQ